MGVENVSPPDPPAAGGDVAGTSPGAATGRVRRVKGAEEDRWERARAHDAEGEQPEERPAKPPPDRAAEEEEEAEQEGCFDRTA